jgi:hypothetical protein
MTVSAAIGGVKDKGRVAGIREEVDVCSSSVAVVSWVVSSGTIGKQVKEKIDERVSRAWLREGISACKGCR